MSLSQVTIYADQIAAQRIGYQAISLTHFDDTSEPQIAQGSVVEIGGALFEAAANESITGWAGISNDTDAYIKLVVSGAAATAGFTDTAPSWDNEKQGWYDGDDRYIGGLYKDGSGNYTIKWLYPAPNDLINQEMIREGQTRPLLDMALDIGDWNMDSTIAVNVAHGIPDFNKIMMCQVLIRNDANNATLILGFNGESNSYFNVDSNIELNRQTGGFFDSTAYDATSYNRGFVFLKYRA